MNPSGKAGAAIVAVLLLVLAITALAHGTLVLSRAELAAARAGGRHLKHRAAADAAVALVLQRRSGSWMDGLAFLEEREAVVTQLAGIPARGTVRRLSAEAWLVEGFGGVTGGVTVRSGRLAWALDPSTRVSDFGAVVEVGAGAVVRVDGLIDGGGPLEALPPLDSDACAPWEPELADAFGGAIPETLIASDSLGPSLGLLGLGPLLDRMDVMVGGVGTPQPSEESGLCLSTAPWNWGDPESPADPCGSFLALRGASGDLTVQGGVGQGVIVVGGDVTFGDGARFYGIVLSGGLLNVREGAELAGLFSARKGVQVTAGSAVWGSACWAVRALGATRGQLGAFVATPYVGRIEPF